MRQFFLFIVLFLIFRQGFGQDKNSVTVRQLNFSQFEPFLHKQNDTLFVINFWATWCIPCRKELPAFEKINDKYKGNKVKVLLVSLDFPKQLRSHLIPFVQTNHLKSEIVLLNEPDPNKWIDKVDTSWAGSIPFSLIYGPGFRESYEHPFEFDELDSIINSKIKAP